MDRILPIRSSHLARSNPSLEGKANGVFNGKRIKLSHSEATQAAAHDNNSFTCTTEQIGIRVESLGITRDVGILAGNTANYLTNKPHSTADNTDSNATTKVPEASFSYDSIKSCDARREQLIKNYLEGNTKNFTDSEWLYLILKFGKLRFSCRSAEWKNDKLMELYDKYGEKFLFLRSKLMMLRVKIEDAVSHYDEKHKKSYSSALPNRSLLTSQLQTKVTVDQIHEIINEARTGIERVQYNITEQLLMDEEIFNIHHNMLFAKLVITCNEHSQYTPPNANTWAQTENELKAVCKNTKFPESFQSCSELDQWISDAITPHSVCGGRTLQIAKNGKTYYFKFLRQGEDINQFIREKAMHEVLHKSGFARHLKSEIPECVGLYSHPYDSKLDQFDDKLAIHSNHEGDERVYAYCFTASEDYVAYAYQITLEQPEDIYQSSELGLRKAAYDIGIFARHGAIFDSILPVLHSTWDGSRKWLSLGGVFANCVSSDADNYARYPGLIEDWSHTATNRPDISKSGLRDLGDSIFINHITPEYHIFEEYGISPDFHFEKVLKSLVFFNTLLDNFVAIILLYGRLHRSDSQYHYHNREAVQKLEVFIENVLDDFLQGYLSDPQVCCKEIMAMGDANYQKWLKKTATEIIYWTAAQPDFVSNNGEIEEISAFVGATEFDHVNQCYVKHILNTGLIDQTLYPMVKTEFNKRDFGGDYRITGEKFLGLNLCIFPLTSLLKGVPHLFSQLVSRSSTV